MPRPRTRGEMIPVRLSLDADAELRRRAERKGMTASAYLVAQVERSLAAKPPLAAVQPLSREVTPRFKRDG